MKTKIPISYLFLKQKAKNAKRKFTISFEDYSRMGAIFRLLWTKLLHQVFTYNPAMREARTWAVSSSLWTMNGNMWVVSCIWWNSHKYRGYNRKYQNFVDEIILWYESFNILVGAFPKNIYILSSSLNAHNSHDSIPHLEIFIYNNWTSVLLCEKGL